MYVSLTKEEIEEAYEKNTGVLIAEYFKNSDYEAVPAVLCKNHGPFTWGKDAARGSTQCSCSRRSSKNGMPLRDDQSTGETGTTGICRISITISKHGANAYYGQIKK